MGFTPESVVKAIESLRKEGVRVELAFDEKSLQKMLLYGILFAVASGLIHALISKYIR